MASTYTTNSGIEKPGTGEQSGLWGDTVNLNMDIIDRLTNGVGAISLSGTTHTLTVTDGALSDGQFKVLVLGGSPTGTNTITVAPNDADRWYIVKNSSGESAIFTQGSGGDVTVLNGDTKIIYCDGAGAGAAVVDVTNNFAMGSVNIDGGTIDGVTLGTNSAVTEAQIDNLNINGNTISSTDTDGNIVLTPDGTGEVDISKVDIDSGTIDGVTLGTNSAVTEAQIDNININGNTISSTDTDGDITLDPDGTGNVVVASGSLNVDEINDAAGTGAPDFPNGVSVNSNPIPTAGSLSNRNKIINGNFDIWQRGTSFTSGGYAADRWRLGRIGSTFVATREGFTLGQTTVPNEPTYFQRVAVTSVSGASNYALIEHRVESVRTFAGQTVTLSFWAKADASKNIAAEIVQNFGTGGSPSSGVFNIGTTTCALTTSFQKFTVTATIPSISGKTLGSDNNDYLSIRIWFDAGSSFNGSTNSLGQQSGTFDIAQVQLEAGDVATPFETRSYGQELALCQRYYEVRRGAGVSYSSSAAGIQRFWIELVDKRTSPTTTVTQILGTATSPFASVVYSDGIYVGFSSTASSQGIIVQATADAEL